MEISAVIITFNEEKRLEPALKSLAGVASEIIVVDSFSSDGTVKLAKKYTKEVFQRQWIDFTDQKNFANNDFLPRFEKRYSRLKTESQIVLPFPCPGRSFI